MMEIESFFNSEEFIDRPFSYIVKTSNVSDLENWNKPLEYATGKYIAILEGDDQFLEKHLIDAKKVLSENSSIGLYFAKSKRGGNCSLSGIVKSYDYIDFQMKLICTPPPSQSIFVRKHLGKIFFYNTKEYVYAPEIDLYLRICHSGCDVFVSDKYSIERDREFRPKPFKVEQFIDRFTVLKTWGPYLNNVNSIELRRHYCRLLFNRYVNCLNLSSDTSSDVWNTLFLEVKKINHVLLLYYFILKIGVSLFHSVGLLGVLIKVYKKIK